MDECCDSNESGDWRGDDKEDEDDDNYIGPRAFGYDSSQLSNHPSGLPINGHDYLKMVEEERNKLPAIVSMKPTGAALAPLKARDNMKQQVEQQQNVAMAIDENTIDQIMRQQRDHPHPRALKDISLASTSSDSSSDRLFSPDKHNEESPRKQLGLEPLINTNASINMSLFSAGAIDEQDETFNGDVSMASCSTSYTNRPSMCSIASSKVFREKIESKSNLFTDRSKQRKNDESMMIRSKKPLSVFNELKAEIAELRKDKTEDTTAAELSKKQDLLTKSDMEQETIEAKRVTNQEDKNKSMNDPGQLPYNRPDDFKIPSLTELASLSQLDIHLMLEECLESWRENQLEILMNQLSCLARLLASLREPIDTDICSTLRQLAKYCIAERSAIEQRSQSAVPTVSDFAESDYHWASTTITATTEADMLDLANSKSRAPSDESIPTTSKLRLMDYSSSSSSPSGAKLYLVYDFFIQIVHHVFGQKDLR